MRVGYPKINPLTDLEPKEVADVIDTLRDQNVISYDDDDGSVIYGEHIAVKRNVTFKSGENTHSVDIDEVRRFSDFENVALSWTQRGGKRTYNPRIDYASPIRFVIKIDDNNEDVTFSRLEFKGR